jgi:hypothetical protein
MKTLLIIFTLLFVQPSYPSYDLAKKIQMFYDPTRKDYVVLIDFRKPMSEKRLFVFDMEKKELILASTVSHAFNSGKNYATDFSNQVNSKKSSVGAFITLNSFWGRWGYSMRLKGVDGDINNNAELRGVIFHSNILKKTSYSEGCFETPEEINEVLIDLVKDGCLIYVYE